MVAAALEELVDAFASAHTPNSAWASAESTERRLSTARSLAAAMRAAPAARILPLLPQLTELLRPSLLDGRPGRSAVCFGACSEVVAAAASQLGDRSLPLVDTLLPLLVDQAGCTGAASAVGAHAHGAVCAILPHVPTHDALPALLGALALPVAPAAGRCRLAESVLLALLTRADVAGALRGRRAPALAAVLCNLLHDSHATTRRLSRHALLVLMETSPRAASEPFARLPLRSQRQLAAFAKKRTSALGPPLLAPSPRPPPHAQATMLQALARGMAARRRSRAAAAFLASLSVGDAVLVYGHAGVLRFRGTCTFAPGLWLGVELHRPVGKHDGAFKGQRFFRCPPRHGLFVRPNTLDDSAHRQRHAREVRAPPTPRTPPPKHKPPPQPPNMLIPVSSQTPAIAPHPLPAPAAALSPPGPSAAATPGGTPGASASRPSMRVMLESHLQVLGSMRSLCEGQLTMLRAQELTRRMSGEGGRAEYLRRMDMLCQQQRLLAMQLGDAVRDELQAVAHPAE